MAIMRYKVTKNGKHSGFSTAGTFETKEEAESYAASQNIFNDAIFFVEHRKIGEFSLLETVEYMQEIQAEVDRLGTMYDNLSGFEYNDQTGENMKEAVGEQIHDCYAEMGAVMDRQKELH